MINKLVADYRDAGWDVVLTHDRDGTALVFRDSVKLARTADFDQAVALHAGGQCERWAV